MVAVPLIFFDPVNSFFFFLLACTVLGAMPVPSTDTVSTVLGAMPVPRTAMFKQAVIKKI